MSSVEGRIVGGRFELRARAGAGGMGAVWRARDRDTDADVAVKVLHARAHDQADRFEREAQLLARLAHPAIVRYVTHGVDAGEPFLAMEWLEGEDLATRLARGPLSVADSIAVADRICEALEAAHALGVVHRDIKPSNLWLVGGDVRRTKVLDFGIARLPGMTLAATRAGRAIGTPGYMAPEQARGAKTADPRTDLFALGCVLHECLTGVPAFSGEHVMAVLAKVLLEEPPPPSTLVRDIPPALDVLVARMLSKEVAGRPADAAAVRAGLRAASQAATPSAAIAPAASAVGQTERKRVFVVIAGVTADDALAPGPVEASAATVSADALASALAGLRTVGRAFGARVEGLAGGAVIAALSAGGSATDGAVQAARCALAIRRELPDEPMAVVTGSAVVGASGAIGEAIDRAVALVRADARRRDGEGARPVRLDDATAGLLDPRFEVRASGQRIELVGEREADESVRTLLGRPTPCVGRDREIATLMGVLAESIAEHVPRAVLVTAPPGTGKTRVRYEAVKQAERLAEPPQVWIARADPLAAGSPFGLLGQLVRRAAGVRDGESESVRSRALALRVERRIRDVGEARRVAEFLGELAGVPASDPSEQLRAAREDAALMADQMLRAWEQWLRAECDARPVLLVLEDLHWGDLPSLRFVGAALGRLADRPLMVLATARPEVHETFPRLWADRGIVEINLGALTPRAAERLIRATLADDAAAETVTRLVTLSAGNAFYLEELIRAVAEGRGDALPESVLAMAQVRYESIDPEARRILRAASVYGETFWYGGVRALLGGADTTLDAWLPRLVERELIERRSQSRFGATSCSTSGCGNDEDEYGFRHALLREAAYAALTPDDRGGSHRVAADWLASAGETDPVRLAEHHERGGAADLAAASYLRAAEQAIDGGDFEGALRRAEHGISLAGDSETAGALWLAQCEALRWAGRGAEAGPAGTRAMELLPVGSARWFRAVVEHVIGGFQWAYGQDGERMLEVMGTVELAPQTRAAWAVAASRLVTHAVVHREQLGVARVAARLEAVVPDLAHDHPGVLGWWHEARAFLHADAGRFDGAIREFDAAHEAFARVGDRRNAILQQTNLGYALLAVSMYDEALAVAERALQAATALGVSRVVFVAGRLRATASVYLGRSEDVLTTIREQLAAVPGGWRSFLQAMSLHELGRLDEAEAVAREGLEQPAIPTLDLKARLGAILVSQGRHAEALPHLRHEPRPATLFADGQRIGRHFHLRALIEAQLGTGDVAGARATLRDARASVLAAAARLEDERIRRAYLEQNPDHATILRLAREHLGD